MQAADFFAALPIAGAQAQGQAKGAVASDGLTGLFGGGEGEGAEGGLLDASGFAEALFAVLAVPPQPQQVQQQPAAPVEGEAAFAAAPLAPADIAARNALFMQDLAQGAAAAIDTGALETAAIDPDATLPVDIDALVAKSFSPPAPADGAIEPAVAAQDFTPEDVDPDLVPPPTTEPPRTTRMTGRTHDALSAPAPSSTAPAAAPPVPAPPAGSPRREIAAFNASQPPAPAHSEPLPVAPGAGPSAPAIAAAAQPPVPTKVAAPEGRGQSRRGIDPMSPAAAPRGPDAPAAAAQAAAPEDTLLETAVSAPAAPDAEVALTADEPAPPLFHQPAHAQAADHSPVFAEPKSTPQTVALLSAQIAKSLENGKSTRFEVQLEPLGLGKVDVKIEIKASGDVRADLSFESPLAASELRARSGELASALEKAGFDPAKTQLSFNSGGQNGSGQFAQDFWQGQQQQQNANNWRGAAFMDLGDVPPVGAASAYSAGAREGGVDVRI